jgi:hypothetical protein
VQDWTVEITTKDAGGDWIFKVLWVWTGNGFQMIPDLEIERLDAHESSPHGKVYFPKIRASLESITVEYFDVASYDLSTVRQ